MKFHAPTIAIHAIALLCALAPHASAGDIDNDGVDDAIDACVNTPPGIPVNAQGRPNGDVDLDCDCDLADFALFAASMTGPLPPAEEFCDDGMDNDGDGLIDCEDAPNCPSGAACGSQASCEMGVCSCEMDWGDCDGLPGNGCETDLLTDVDHCGDCANPCINAHGATQCTIAQCDPTCDGLWDSCDVNPDNGCETPLTTLSNCGACAAPCSLPNAGETCDTGTCQITTCNDSWCNLNGNPVDGCELNLDTNPGCGTAIDLGAIPGDTGSGTVSIQGRGETWYRVYIAENDTSGPAVDLCARVAVSVPAGVNYDLFVYCDGCGGPGAVSANPGSTSETAFLRWDEETNLGIPSGSDSGRFLTIRVTFTGGTSCAMFNLTVFGNVCSGANTCSTL